jgi:hypothetical protein
MNQPIVTLTRDASAPWYTKQPDGWYRCMEKNRPSYGYGLMIRRVMVMGHADRELNCSDVFETERRVWKIKIWYCPSSDDTGLSMDTSLGHFYGTNYQLQDFLDDVRKANELGCWMP